MLYVDSLSAADGPVPTYIDLLNVTVSTIVKGLKIMTTLSASISVNDDVTVRYATTGILQFMMFLSNYRGNHLCPCRRKMEAENQRYSKATCGLIKPQTRQHNDLWFAN